MTSPKTLDFDEEVCASFIIKDQEKVIDTILEFPDNIRRYIFDTIDHPDQDKDSICELFQSQDRAFLAPNWNGIVYKFASKESKYPLIIVYSDERIPLLHFMKDHAIDDYQMDRSVMNSSIKSFVTEKDIKWLKDRSLTNEVDYITNL